MKLSQEKIIQGYLYYREIINSKFNKKLLETIINPKSKSKSIFNIGNLSNYPDTIKLHYGFSLSSYPNIFFICIIKVQTGQLCRSLNKDKFPKINDTKNRIKKSSKKHLDNNFKKNPYYLFKTNKSLYKNDYTITFKGFSNGSPHLKTINIKNDYILKFINRAIESHNNFFVKYKQRLVYNNSINKNIIFNNFVGEENNNKVY